MSYTKGFIKIPRSFIELPLWNDTQDVALWLYCLLCASHNKFGHLQKGQFYTSKQKMAKDLHWSRMTLDAHLKNLIEQDYIQISSSFHGTTITVKRWEQVTDTGSEYGTNTVQPHVQKFNYPVQKIDAGVQQVYGTCTESGYNQDKNQYRKESLSSDTPVARARAFERWWAAYPRHEDRTGAIRAYMRVDATPEVLFDALERAKTSRQWLQADGRFIPTAARWLDGGWLDYAQDELERKRKERPVWTTY